VTRLLAFLAAGATLALGPASLGPCSGDAAWAASGARACCRICTKGKACGNSCIASWKQCHKGKGCACNG
jgi:hypothetical protein